MQGGTCIFSGDEVQLLEQAAEIAEQYLKCTTIFGSVPLFKEGYSRARFSALDANSTCAPNLDHLLTSWLSLESYSRHLCHDAGSEFYSTSALMCRRRSCMPASNVTARRL